MKSDVEPEGPEGCQKLREEQPPIARMIKDRYCTHSQYYRPGGPWTTVCAADGKRKGVERNGKVGAFIDRATTLI